MEIDRTDGSLLHGAAIIPYAFPPMFRRYRQRRGPYALARPSVVPSFVRSLILLLIAGTVLYFLGRGIIRLFGMGSGLDRAAVGLTVEKGGTVNISLEGGLMQRADDTMTLYATDKISTASTGRAVLSFFEDSWIRLDGSTDLTIDTSEKNEEEAAVAVTLTKGSLWVDTPSADIYSGSILRTISTDAFTLTIPADTQAAVDGKTLLVFSADGNGVGVTLKGSEEEQFIGEGQQLSLPDKPGTNALQYRSAIDPLVAQKPFVTESKAMTRAGSSATGSGTGIQIDPNAIVLSSPADNAAVSTPTVTVAGTAGSNVARVRINGHEATVNRTTMSFSEELALTDAATTDIRVEALDMNDIVLDQVSRTIRKTIQTIVPPTITNPAKNGQTYRTQDAQVEIRGTAPAGAAGMMVNDYKLQLFRANDTTWSYLASKQLNNLVDGKNVFNVYAIDAAGNPSAPATLTVLVEAGTVGVVSTGSTIGSTPSSAAPTQIDEATLPQNAPLTAGVITVTGPTAGTAHTATGSDILIEGTTSAQTASVWVNGYKLQLYKAGVTRWNYIAKTDYGTLKRGTNVYKINARDANNQILDSFTYTVQY